MLNLVAVCTKRWCLRELKVWGVVATLFCFNWFHWIMPLIFVINVLSLLSCQQLSIIPFFHCILWFFKILTFHGAIFWWFLEQKAKRMIKSGAGVIKFDQGMDMPLQKTEISTHTYIYFQEKVTHYCIYFTQLYIFLIANIKMEIGVAFIVSHSIIIHGFYTGHRC